MELFHCFLNDKCIKYLLITCNIRILSPTVLGIIGAVEIVVKNISHGSRSICTLLGQERQSKKITNACKVYPFALNTMEKKIKQGKTNFLGG